MELHNMRWRDRGGSDAFHTPGLVSFHREFSQLALKRGWLRLYVLRLNQKPAACLYGFLYGRTFYFYQSGFDSAYEKQSVGLVSMGLGIKSAIAEGAEEYDLIARKRRIQVSLEPREPGTGQIGIISAGQRGTHLPPVGGTRAGFAPDCPARAVEAVRMIRSWAKTGAAGVLSWTGMDKVVGLLAGSMDAPVVIGYHRVVENFAASAATSIPSMLVSRQMLERHLDWLGRRFRFVSLDELGARLDGSDGSHDAIAAITFDDSYRDFYDHAFPLLRQKGIPAAVFVVTGLVNTTGVQIHDKLYLLLMRRFADRNWKPGDLGGVLQGLGISLPNVIANTPYQATRALLEALPQESIRTVMAALESETPIPENTFQPFYSLTWEMLDRIQRAGMTIGSHTRTHVLMNNESGDRVVDEVTGSREEIERRLGATVRHFAYPSGQFNTASVNAVANAGYRFGYTVCQHRDAVHPQLTVPRTLLWENSSLDFRGAFSGPILSCQIHRAFDVLRGCRERHGVSQESGYARQ